MHLVVPTASRAPQKRRAVSLECQMEEACRLCQLDTESCSSCSCWRRAVYCCKAASSRCVLYMQGRLAVASAAFATACVNVSEQEW